MSDSLLGTSGMTTGWCKTDWKAVRHGCNRLRLFLARKSVGEADFEVRSDGDWSDWESVADCSTNRCLQYSSRSLEDIPELRLDWLGMIEWIALGVSLLAFSFSLKAYLDSKWIEIDWNFKDEDE
jgi:hypothetical protein